MSEYGHGSNGQAASTPDFIAAEGKVEGLGAQIGGQAPRMGSHAEKTGAIQIDFPYFGVVGLRANLAHNEARASAVKALNAGKAVLESWPDVLTQTEKNFQAANANAAKAIDEVGKGSGSITRQTGYEGPGSLDTSGLTGPNANIPDTSGLNAKFPNSPGTDLDTSGLTGPNANIPDTSGPNATFPDLPGTDPNTPDLPRPNTPDLPDSNTPDLPEMPSAGDLPNSPGTKLPELDQDALGNGLTGQDAAGLGDRDLRLPDPKQTDLSAYNPSNPLNSLNLPTPQPTSPDSGRSFDDQAGTGSLTRAGGSSGGSPNTVASALNGTRAAGANGANGMPFMPPMMGGGAPGGEQKDQPDSGIKLSQDESVWDGDEDTSPAVLGREA